MQSSLANIKMKEFTNSLESFLLKHNNVFNASNNMYQIVSDHQRRKINFIMKAKGYIKFLGKFFLEKYFMTQIIIKI